MLCVATSLAAQQVRPPAPLLDRARFFEDPALANVQISPDAQWLAFRAPHDGVMQLWIAPTHGVLDSAVRLSDGPAESFVWSRDSRYLLFFRDRDGDENYHLYAVDADTAGAGVPRDLTPYGAVRARIYALPGSAPEAIIAGLNDRDPTAYDVYRIDIASGERELVRRNDAQVADWVTDLDGNVRLGVLRGPDGSVDLLRVSGDTLSPVFGCAPDETCRPIRFHWDGRRVYIATNRGDRDLTELILFHPDTFEEELVERDPEGRVDFGEAVFSPGSDALVATVYHDDTTRIYSQDSVFTRDLARLAEHLRFAGLALGSASGEGALWIVHVEGDTDPGSTYLFDSWNNTIDLVGEWRPQLSPDRLATSVWISYATRDGSRVPALLTLPPGDSTSNLPAVLLPHDGPWTRDRWRFNPLVQFLANRGYAVLQPNFRGSRGYGKAFLAAGNGAWGTGVMQHDLTDAVRYLTERGIADPGRLGIVGFGYGGYAALAALAFTPDRFAAGVAVSAMTDLPRFLADLPPYEALARASLYYRVGNPDLPEERARLESQSPALAARRMTQPVLLAHGVNDPQVSIDQSERMVAALRAAGNAADYLRIAGEGHRLRRATNRIAFAAVLERFLALHLGGRVQDSLATDIADLVNAMTVGAGDALGAAGASTAPLPEADGSLIQRATLVYRVTTSDGDETEFVRRIVRTRANRRDIWRVIDSTMVPVFPQLEFDTTGLAADPRGALPEPPPREPPAAAELAPAADTMDVDRRTLLPLQRRVGGPVTIMIDYTADSVSAEFEVSGFFDDVHVRLEAPVFADGSGLELVIAGLPLTEGYETGLRVFDMQLRQVVPLTLTVTGTERVDTPAGRFDAFRVTLTPVDVRDAESRSLLVRQQAPHVVIRADMRVAGDPTGFTQTVELIAVERL